MAHKFDQTKQIGGLNSDDEVRNLSPLDYLYALNIHNAINSLNQGRVMTNVKGNVPITKYILPYSPNNTFPAGKNRCIGAFEDTRDKTVIFFVWNSNNNHQILRYYRSNSDPLNPYGEVQQIMMYDFGWRKNQRITSVNIAYGTPNPGDETQLGDLLYWCDPVPKKINLTKGNICVKQKSWNLYAPQTNVFIAPTPITLLVKDVNAQILYNLTLTVPPCANSHDGLAYINTQILAQPNQFFTTTLCDCHLQLVEIGTNSFDFTISFQVGGNNALLIVPDNWYGNNLIDRFFDRCKWEPLYAPSGAYKQDTNYLPNYVDKKVFQFRTGYLYDDLEPSSLGVYSQIPINNLQCDGSPNTVLNYIDVDFNDPALFDPMVLVLLKKVRFIARNAAQNSAESTKDRQVIDLEPCDFLDYDITTGTWFCHYKFYNNIISNSVSDAIAEKQFDNIPLESNCELLVKDRMVEGGVLTGYNAPECPSADFKITINEDKNTLRHKIKGRIRILTYGLDQPALQPFIGCIFENFFPNSAKYPFWQPPITAVRGGIFHNVGDPTDGADFPFFGGGMFVGNTFGIRPGMATSFDQRLPLGGFVVYAAGTNYLAVSKQTPSANGGFGIGLPTDSVGALTVASQSEVDAIGNYYKSFANQADLYSDFELVVPDGEYVIRLASHWCSFGDVLDRGFAYDLNNGLVYQKTSTNVHGCYDANGVWKPWKEFTVIVNGGDVTIGDFVVMDVAPPWKARITQASNRDYWQGINGYLYDDQGATDPNAPSFQGVPVEKTLVAYAQTSAYGFSDVCTTDCNGYFFGIGGTHHATGNSLVIGGGYNFFQVAAYNLQAIRVEDTVLATGTITDLINKTLQVLNFSSAPLDGTGVAWVNGQGLVWCIVTTNQTIARQSSRQVQGNIVDQNNDPVAGALVVYENGRTAFTLANGVFSFLAWTDATTANLGVFNNASFIPQAATGRNVDSVIYSAAIFCFVSYPNGQSYNFQLVLQTQPSFAIRILPTFHIVENAGATINALKRGGKYIIVSRYYDEAGRQCTCAQLAELYIPFETEDLGLYPYVVDSSGNPFPLGTYKGGKPTVTYTLNYNPPQFAAYGQIMRSKNLIYGRYLQWVANEVVYVAQIATSTTPEIDTEFQNGDATAIKISIENIVNYYTRNNDSIIGYSFQGGDRVRLIYDRDLNLIHGINDFEVTSYDATTGFLYVRNNGFTVEIKSGFVIEIFNPKSVATEDEQILYEIGDVIPCTNPGQPNNQHSFSTGIISGADTYWKGRTIVVNDANSNYITQYQVIIEDASISDFYFSLAEDIGRLGIIDPNFVQIFKPSLMMATDSFLPSTATNGLSSVPLVTDIVLQKELDRKYGSIQRLFFEQNNLIAVMSNKEVSNYIYRQTIYNAQNPDGIQAESSQFFGTDYVHEKNLGTDLPAVCLVNNDGIPFGWNSGSANVWKMQGDGEKVISDMKMISFFKQLSLDGVTDAVATYDRFHEEYIITYWRKQIYTTIQFGGYPNGFVFLFTAEQAQAFRIGDDVQVQYSIVGASQTVAYYRTVDGEVVAITKQPDGGYGVSVLLLQDIVSINGRFPVSLIYSVRETISWFEGAAQNKEMAEKWITFYSFLPENLCSLDVDIVSFVDGRIWLHGQNPLYNNFYGVQYDTIITPVFNNEPDLRKVWNSMVLETLQDNFGNDWSIPVISNSNNQLSRINNAAWVKKTKEQWFAPFKRDLNDVSKPLNLRITQGMALRSTSLTCKLVNTHTGLVSLYSWMANYSHSERTGK